MARSVKHFISIFLKCFSIWLNAWWRFGATGPAFAPWRWRWNYGHSVRFGAEPEPLGQLQLLDMTETNLNDVCERRLALICWSSHKKTYSDPGPFYWMVVERTSLSGSWRGCVCEEFLECRAHVFHGGYFLNGGVSNLGDALALHLHICLEIG